VIYFVLVILAGLYFAGWLMSHPNGVQRDSDFPPSLSRTLPSLGGGGTRSWSPVAWASCAWAMLKVGGRRIKFTLLRGGDQQ
jgi:hypothetical protein